MISAAEKLSHIKDVLLLYQALQLGPWPVTGEIDAVTISLASYSSRYFASFRKTGIPGFLQKDD